MTAINNICSAADRERVNQAVQKAESKTSAEILPVVAQSSGRYDRPEDIVGLWLALVALAVTWYFYPLPVVEAGNWNAAAPWWQLAALLVATLAGFVIGAIVGGRVNSLRRMFTPRSQMRAEVFSKARQIFFDQRVHHTGGGSGVLLYVSLFEHMAAVIADRSIIEKLGEEQIDAICDDFTSRLHNGNLVDAICVTAESLGDQLGPLLPRSTDDVNELPDALVVID